MPRITGRVELNSLDARLTPWRRFEEDWKNCDRCLLAANRSNVVLAKGKVPCDVLFCGEAPGRSEDALGAPFVGPAGKLLDGIIGRSVPEGTRVAFANVLGCIPLNEDGDVKIADLPKESVEACRPRLERFILEVAWPRLIVCLGKVAAEWFDAKAYRKGTSLRAMVEGKVTDPFAGIVRVNVIHPAAILRSVVAYRDLAIQKCEVDIRDACNEVFAQGES